MAHSYPIWNKITACIYKGNKSYGIKETGETKIYVGTSKKNSHHFQDHKTTVRKCWFEKTVTFKFSVDDIILKEMIFKQDKNGNAGELIKTITNLKK